MRPVASLLARRLLASVVALTVAVAAFVGCGHGGPTAVLSASGGGTLRLPSASWNADAATFCKEFNLNELGQIWTSTDPKAALGDWDAFTAEAPSDIRPDFQFIDDYLRSVVNLHPDSSKAAQVSTAERHIADWTDKNCPSS